MPARTMRKYSSWLPYVLAAGTSLGLALVCWQMFSDWRDWEHYKRGPARITDMRPGTLAWKQPVLPAQFEEGSCGACHRSDAPETPRLNHGRQLLVKFNCVGCHRLQDVDHPAMLGPDLTNVGTKVSREWIYKWLKDPRTLTDASGTLTVDGVATDPRMPRFRLTEVELRALSAYLSVQRTKLITPYRFNARAVTMAARNGDAADKGQIRFNQMFCVTCHSLAVDRGGETTLIGGDIGPELTKVGSKVKADWLVSWLRDPQGYLEHTRMPRYQWSDEDLYEVSQYILKRLTDPDLLKDVPQLGSPTDEELQLGRRLFVDKGCAECHAIEGVTARPNFGPDLSALGMAAGPYLVEVKLPRKESKPLHFVGASVEKLDVSVSKVPKFMIAYIQAKITDPASVSPQTHMPQFHMSQADLDDLTMALLSMSGPPIQGKSQNPVVIERPHTEFHPDGQFGQLYQRYKCYVCHAFNGYGGSLAPELSYEGSRSRREWLVQFLMSPQTLRPTLTVRMPVFNMPQEDAAAIADYLSSSLRHTKVDPAAIADAQFTEQMAARGKQLYETKFQCQSCHTIGSSGGYVGPSLNNAGNWLTPAWIEAWLNNPQAMVPGTIEPRQSFAGDEIRDITAYLLTLKQVPAAKSDGSSASSGGQQ